MTLETLIDELVEIQNSEDYEEGARVVLVDDSNGTHRICLSSPTLETLKTKENYKQTRGEEKVVVIS